MLSKTTIKVPLYECKVILIVTTSMEELQQYVLKKKKVNIDVLETHGAVFNWGGAEYVVALKEESLGHNLIAHEMFHLAIAMTNDIAIEDEESQAWLVGHLTQQVYKILNKKNFVIKA
jgi:hypothetical protein